MEMQDNICGWTAQWPAEVMIVAATRIQAVWRGTRGRWLARGRLAARTEAAIRIQVCMLCAPSKMCMINRVAIRQAAVRGWLARLCKRATITTASRADRGASSANSSDQEDDSILIDIADWKWPFAWPRNHTCSSGAQEADCTSRHAGSRSSSNCIGQGRAGNMQSGRPDTTASSGASMRQVS